MPAFTPEQNKALANMFVEWAEAIDQGKAVYVADAMRSAAKGCLRHATEAEELDQVFAQNAKFVNGGVLKCGNTASNAELRKSLFSYLAQLSPLKRVISPIRNQKTAL